MGAAEKMAAGTHLANGIHGLTAFAEIHATRQAVQHRELVGVHDELLVTRDESRFEPASRVGHEVHARQHRGQQRVGALVAGLGVDHLRGTQAATAATWDAETPRELRGREDHLRGLRCAKGR